MLKDACRKDLTALRRIASSVTPRSGPHDDSRGAADRLDAYRAGLQHLFLHRHARRTCIYQMSEPQSNAASLSLSRFKIRDLA